MTISDLKTNEFADYYSGYINRANDLNLLTGLKQSGEDTLTFFKAVPNEKLEYAYLKDKWTIKELLLHLIDAERVFAYRALRFARQDLTALPGFDENDYVRYSNANSLNMEALLKSYKALRVSTISLFESFTTDMLLQVGKASGSDMSVRAIGFVIIGHEKHHVEIIKERYL
ncbi:DinB family protein [Hanstruepera marina]|uniref:DinB family protein n=1 Tax=Hanstruepera marina TaxID=2873265 RepID=UPI001CA78F44|nr:DinB family protein [Hanstruepera marina]